MKRYALLSLATGLMMQVQATEIGLNIPVASSTTGNAQIASLMQTRNFRHARIGYFFDQNVTLMRDEVTRINQNGGKVQLVMQTSYQWDFSCNQNLPAVEQDSYNQTHRMVGAMKDLVHDYEMLNEIQLRPDVKGQVPFNNQLSSTTAYQNSSCSATLAAAVRGMSRAIHDHGQRAILGHVGRDWGFLTYMKNQGVTWDVTGYHLYPYYEHASLQSDPWWGANGPLYQLSLFGKPVTVNEFNCGEIYEGNYENTAGQPVTEKCLKSVDKHLQELLTNRYGTIESVLVYQVFDEPQKAAPENHFGLMYNPTQPKPHLYLVGAYAGGSLTAAERNEIVNRGLLTNAEIDAMQKGSATPPPPAPESSHGSAIPPSAALADASGASWTVTGGVIYRNGVATVSSSVTLLLYWNHTIYQQNSAGGWWLWANNGWQATTDPRVVTPPPSAPSPAPAPADAQAPSVSIASPGNGTSLSRNSQFNVTANASDDVGVTEVSFYLNGAQVCTDTAAPYSCTLTLPGKRNATHTIEVKARDAAGKVGSASVRVYTAR
jgi:hypothetical protein